MPDEAESAEEGTVTSEVTWAAESSAASGNGSGPRVPSFSRNGPACPPLLGPSGPVQVPGGSRDPLQGHRNVPLRGARGGMEHPTPRLGDSRSGAGGRLERSAWGLGVAPPISGIPWWGAPGWGREWVQGPILRGCGWSILLRKRAGKTPPPPT